MEAFDAYGHAIVALALMVIVWGAMNPLSAINKEKAGAAPGGSVPEDYTDPAYRWQRAYANLTEVMPFFVAAVVAAMLAGASAVWVNWLASLFLLSRIAVAVAHVRGIGKPSGGLRSILFTVGWAISLALAVLAMVAVF